MKIPLIVKAFGIAIPVGATFVDCVGCIAKVDGVSMRPSLNPVPGQDDFVFLNKWAVRNYDISRGEIISFIPPKNPHQRFIKRVVGLEGDIVYTSGYKKKVVTVPQGHCWVEGDHAGSSVDSNSFGPIALGLITAKATHIVWPPSRWCSLQNGTVVSCVSLRRHKRRQATWNLLRQAHECMGPVKKLTLYKQLLRIRFDSQNNVSKYVKEFSSKAKLIERAGLKLSEELLSIVLSSSLPAEFYILIVDVETRDEISNFESLKIKLTEEE